MKKISLLKAEKIIMEALANSDIDELDILDLQEIQHRLFFKEMIKVEEKELKQEYLESGKVR